LTTRTIVGNERHLNNKTKNISKNPEIQEVDKISIPIIMSQNKIQIDHPLSSSNEPSWLKQLLIENEYEPLESFSQLRIGPNTMGPGLHQYAENIMNGKATFTNRRHSSNSYTPPSSTGSSRSHHQLPSNGAASLGRLYFSSSDDSLPFTNHSLPNYHTPKLSAPLNDRLPSSGKSLGQRYSHSFSKYDRYPFDQTISRDAGYAAVSATHHHGLPQYNLGLPSSETGPLGQEYTEMSSEYGQSATGFGAPREWEEVNYWTDKGYGSAHIAEVYSMNLLTEASMVSEEFVDWQLARTKEYSHLYQ
jgi:hypothetical protein